MRFVLVTTVKDVRRRLADPAALLLWIGIPLVLSALLNFIAGTNSAAPRARLLIVDQDDTVLSRLVPAAAGQGNSPIDTQVVTLDEGRRRIDAGDATALLILPKGFQAAVFGTGSANLQLLTNPSQRILPGIVQQGSEVLVDAAFYVQRLFGGPIRRIADQTGKGPPAAADVAVIAVEISRQITALQGSLLPPVISVATKAADPAAAPAPNFGQVFLPGMLFMSFLFIASGMSGDIWDEKQHGTLRRLMATPQSPGGLLLGKLLAGAAVSAVVALVGLLAAVVQFDLAWSRVPLALVWCAFGSSAIMALLMVMQTSAGSQRGGELLASVLTFPLMMLGGSFFPFESMPAWMVGIGQWTPNGLAVARLKDLMYGSVSPTALGVAALGIGIPAAAAFALTWRRLWSFARA